MRQFLSPSSLFEQHMSQSPSNQDFPKHARRVGSLSDDDLPPDAIYDNNGVNTLFCLDECLSELSSLVSNSNGISFNPNLVIDEYASRFLIGRAQTGKSTLSSMFRDPVDKEKPTRYLNVNVQDGEAVLTIDLERCFAFNGHCQHDVAWFPPRQQTKMHATQIRAILLHNDCPIPAHFK